MEEDAELPEATVVDRPKKALSDILLTSPVSLAFLKSRKYSNVLIEDRAADKYPILLRTLLVPSGVEVYFMIFFAKDIVFVTEELSFTSLKKPLFVQS